MARVLSSEVAKLFVYLSRLRRFVWPRRIGWGQFSRVSNGLQVLVIYLGTGIIGAFIELAR